MTDINESVSVLTSVLVGEKSMNWLTRNLNLADDLILLMFNKANGSDFLHFLALQIYLPFVNRIISLFVSFLIVFFFSYFSVSFSATIHPSAKSNHSTNPQNLHNLLDMRDIRDTSSTH